VASPTSAASFCATGRARARSVASFVTGDPSRQYDTWDGNNTAPEDWIGYSYSTPYSFNRIVFQEGISFWDGGWFDTLNVQVRQNGVWTNVANLTSAPPYSATNDGVSYQSYTLSFSTITGDGIR